jgi:hypothetical protein
MPFNTLQYKMTTESVFILANKYENDETLSPYEKETMREAITVAIQNVLKRWTLRLPEEKLKLFGDRLKRPVNFIQNRIFHLDLIWARGKEVVIHYKTNEQIDLIISITPKLLLIKDREFYMREAAFPID